MDPTQMAQHYAPRGSLAINDGPPSVGRAAIAEAARGFYIALPVRDPVSVVAPYSVAT